MKYLYLIFSHRHRVLFIEIQLKMTSLIIQALIVVGGADGSQHLSSMLTLFPGADTWTSLASLPRKLYGARASTLGGRLRLFGGAGPDYSSKVFFTILRTLG